MKTQLVLCLGGTLLAGMSACKSEAPKKEVPMNVIYILADDLDRRKSIRLISIRWRRKVCCSPSIMRDVRSVPRHAVR